MNVFEEIVRSNDESLLQWVYNMYTTKERDLKTEGSINMHS